MNMDKRLISTLADLERFGIENDEKAVGRSDKMLNITHETGEFLSILVKATNARNVLEIGTSNGYSTIWLADAVRKINGLVTTIESDQCKVQLAEQNFVEAGVSDYIKIKKIKAEEFFNSKQERPFDFIFLDSDRSNYHYWWPELQELLKPGGLIVVDNAISHLDELVNFTSLVKVTQGYETSIVPIGNGELLIWKVA
jgi:predicted O-methyltransferase YrrM